MCAVILRVASVTRCVVQGMPGVLLAHAEAALEGLGCQG